jgi:hypothetical protein
LVIFALLETRVLLGKTQYIAQLKIVNPSGIATVRTDTKKIARLGVRQQRKSIYRLRSGEKLN